MKLQPVIAATDLLDSLAAGVQDFSFAKNARALPRTLDRNARSAPDRRGSFLDLRKLLLDGQMPASKQ